MNKHYQFVNAFSYVWVLFLANSYFMMNYHFDILESFDDTHVNYKADILKNIKTAQTVIVI